MVKVDLSAFNVSLFALSQFVNWVIIILPVLMISLILSLWKNIVVSSAKSLTLPSGQHLCRSLINNIKNRGPRTEPWGTPQEMGCNYDLDFSS